MKNLNCESAHGLQICARQQLASNATYQTCIRDKPTKGMDENGFIKTDKSYHDPTKIRLVQPPQFVVGIEYIFRNHARTTPHSPIQLIRRFLWTHPVDESIFLSQKTNATELLIPDEQNHTLCAIQDQYRTGPTSREKARVISTEPSQRAHNFRISMPKWPFRTVRFKAIKEARLMTNFNPIFPTWIRMLVSKYIAKSPYNTGCLQCPSDRSTDGLHHIFPNIHP